MTAPSELRSRRDRPRSASAWRPIGPSCSSRSGPRSGPISFGAIGITGHVDAAVSDGVIDTAISPSAHVEIAVDGLRSGNGLYDAELLRRIDAGQFPIALLDLTECAPGAGGPLQRVGRPHVPRRDARRRMAP